jgi:hypothetical protein
VQRGALGAIFSAYFKNRINGTELHKGRQFLTGVERKYAVRKQGPSANDFAGIDQAID